MRRQAAQPGQPSPGRRRHLSGEWPYRIFAALVFCQKLVSRGGQPWAVNAVMPENLFLASRHRMVVWEANDFESRRDASLKQNRGAGLPQTAVDTVLLLRDYPSRFRCSFYYRILVQGFDGVQTQDPALDAFLRQ